MATELSELAVLLPEIDLSLDITGFAPAEIDGLLSSFIDLEEDPSDVLPEIDTKAVTRLGDLWILSDHRLSCADSRDATRVEALFGGDRSAMVFADPPFNVRISSVQGRGKRKHREFAVASGEMSRAEFTEFLTAWMQLAAKFSKSGSMIYCCMDWRHLIECLAAGEVAFTELKNLAVWVKTNAGQGSFYRSRHELILIYKNGGAPHQNNIQLGRFGRSRSNVWEYPNVNSFLKGASSDLSIHPVVKPTGLIADAIRDCTRRGEVIYDPFLGSGTTILAAEKTGRRAYGIEIDPLYVDVAVRRWQEFTKRDAVLEATGQTFDEVAAERSKIKRVRVR